jgi:hypothetical protein
LRSRTGRCHSRPARTAAVARHDLGDRVDEAVDVLELARVDAERELHAVAQLLGRVEVPQLAVGCHRAPQDRRERALVDHDGARDVVGRELRPALDRIALVVGLAAEPALQAGELLPVDLRVADQLAVDPQESRPAGNPTWSRPRSPCRSP